MDLEVISLLVTILLAFVGYIVTYVNNTRLQRRKDRLDRVNQQLRELYGPLYAVVRVSDMVWTDFRSRWRPEGGSWDEQQMTEEEKREWRIWISEIFLPLNLRMETAIMEHADLMIEEQIPESLLVLGAHIAGYKAIVKRWELGDFSENVPNTLFPGGELLEYTGQSYQRLMAEQKRLLGLVHR
jgi:hypothetical protein